MNKYISGIRPKIGIPNFRNILAYDEAWVVDRFLIGFHAPGSIRLLGTPKLGFSWSNYATDRPTSWGNP